MSHPAGAAHRGLLAEFLGPPVPRAPLETEVVERVDCGGHVRSKVRYSVRSGERVSAYVCVPQGVRRPAPAVFCHHQHANEFGLGKSEVVGLAGDPDQAYASELADRGFVTIAPDAIGFEDRNWSPTGADDVSWFELSTRLLHGRTLLADCLSDISAAIDHLTEREDVDASRIGFLGHSYGGKAAFWAAAYDARITAAVSHCGCIPYRLTTTRDTGIQAEFVVPGFARRHDLGDLVRSMRGQALLISATSRDRWSRGAEEVFAQARAHLGERAELALYDGRHEFTLPMRQRAYRFLEQHLGPVAGRVQPSAGPHG